MTETDHLKGIITGQIAGISLSSFLQMLEMEQKTCTIKVLAQKNIGRIYFSKGTLIDAETIHSKHLEAAYQILSWDDIVIGLEKNTLKRQDMINLPLMHVLIESARYNDEIAKDSGNPHGQGHDRTDGRPISSKTLNNKNFCLEMGNRLLVEFKSLSFPFLSTLVGSERNKYLLLKSPALFDSMEPDLVQTKDIIVKSLYKGTIYAFRSRVINTISSPTKLMFIEYPERIEHYELRSHKRFKCNIVAQARVKDNERGGVIENISLGGCLCTLESHAADESLLEDLIDRAIRFRCHFPGSKNEVKFTGELKNVKEKFDELAVGIKFIQTGSSQEARDIIQDYIQLIEYSGENV